LQPILGVLKAETCRRGGLPGRHQNQTLAGDGWSPRRSLLIDQDHYANSMQTRSRRERVFNVSGRW